MKISDLTHALIRASEKGARIARAIRAEEELFSLLIEEKPEIIEHNKVKQDFKTLADVLIQETIKHDLAKQFPGLEKFVYGEEESEFTNTNGETIHVRVCDTEEETCSLLAKVLEGNTKAPQLLAKVVHEDVTLPDIEKISAVTERLSLDSVGIWIDPIDATAQYIAGIEDECPVQGLYSNGLQCVTVLIGVYDRESGIPIIGVMNQAFSTRDTSTKRWQSRFIWGISYKSININSLETFETDSASHLAEQSGDLDETSSAQSKKVKMSHLAQSNASQEEPDTRAKIISSPGENPEILSKFSAKFQVVHAWGAGNKSLSILDNITVAYFNSGSAIYRWDTCCGHAILRTMGGAVLDFHKAWEVVKSCKDTGHLEDGLKKTELTYHFKNLQKELGAKQWANAGGILAYRDIKYVSDILRCLC